ncbi:hypothetical protein BH23GEM11_BH23GEM11_13170 [soil metagenome]
MVGFAGGTGEGGMERFRARMPRPVGPAEDAEDARRVEEAREEERSAGAGREPDVGPEPDARFARDLSSPASPAPSYPDQFADPGPSRDLEDRILVIAAHMELAGHQQLQLLAEFDARRGWELGGHASCAHWLAARAKLDLGTAREKVRVARALEDLPETSAWMALGRISFCQARALTRVATAEDEAELLQAAENMTTAQVERMVRGWRMKSAADAVEREEERQRSRSFSVVPDLDGMYVVRGRLTPEQGALLMRAIEAAGDVLFREETHGQPYEPRVAVPDARPRKDTQAAAARRRADAVTLLAECALGAGFGARRMPEVDAEPKVEPDAEVEAEAEAGPEAGSVGADAKPEGGSEAPAAASPAEPSPFPLSGSRVGRYQVMLHVELDALREDDPTCGTGCSHLDDGVRVSHETSRRLCCDTAVVPLFLDAEGRVADAGRSRRVVSPALRRALEVRGTAAAAFPAVGSATPMPTTSVTGPMAARHRSRTASSSASIIIACSMRVAGRWTRCPAAASSSATPAAAPTTTAAGRSRDWTTSADTFPFVS